MNWYDLHRMRLNFRFENPDKCRASHSELFMYICDLWNKLWQKERFWLPTQVTMELLGIWSYNTYNKIYNDLLLWWFIKEVQKSQNQYSSRIIALSKIDKATDKALDKATIKATDKASDESPDIIDKQINKLTNKQINKEIDDFSQAIINFQEMRKKIKKPMTENAVKLLLWELEKLAPWDESTKIAILNKSIMNCWQWVFQLKEEDKKAMQDPLLVEYERQVWLCYESWRWNESHLEKLSEIMDKVTEKYWKEEATKIRKETRKKICW